MPKDSSPELDVVSAATRSNLYLFLVAAFPLLCPGVKLVRADYVEAMCFALQKVAQGETTRLIISVAPRHLKSICASVLLPAFILGRDPSKKIMVVSYGGDLAREHGEAFRRLVENKFYRGLFPATRFDIRRQDQMKTIAGGGRMAVSLSGATTGFGTDVLILDDLIKAGDVQSPVQRQSVRTHFDEALHSRLNEKATGAIVSVAQRLHVEDTTAFLLEKGSYEHLLLPSITQSAASIPLYYGRVYERAIGDVLNSDREPLEVLNQIRSEIGSYAFHAQYLQEPQLGDSNFLSIGDLHLVDELPDPDVFVRRVQSWDTAAKDGPNCAYSACITAGWHRDEESWYLLNVFRDRLSYPALKDYVISHRKKWRAERVLVEDTAMGISLVQDLWGDGHRWCKPVNATEGKLERFLPVTGWLKDGRLIIPSNEAWFAPFRRELLAFPNDAYADQVDALVQFMQWEAWRGALFLDTDPRTGRRIGKYRRGQPRRV